MRMPAHLYGRNIGMRIDNEALQVIPQTHSVIAIPETHRMPAASPRLKHRVRRKHATKNPLSSVYSSLYYYLLAQFNLPSFRTHRDSHVVNVHETADSYGASRFEGLK